jgi:uncharacterized CHY-type Zn-finger protein
VYSIEEVDQKMSQGGDNILQGGGAERGDEMAIDSDEDVPMNIEGATGGGGGAAAQSTGGSAPAETSADASASEKRRAIQAIMRDASLTDLERRLRIQRLMDGSSTNNDNNTGDSRWSTTSSASAPAITSLIGSNGGSGASGLPSASVLAAASGDNDNGTGNNIQSAEVVACVHYERKCNVVSPCCGRVFGCRVCHDEMSPACEAPMDRFAIKEIVCKECNTKQSSKLSWFWYYVQTMHPFLFGLLLNKLLLLLSGSYNITSGPTNARAAG